MYFKGVKVYNADQPWKYAQGGKIHKKPDMTQKQINNDSVLIVAHPGELIVPVFKKGFEKGELVKKVVSYLRNLGVRLPNT
jgi:hypothetical protein